MAIGLLTTNLSMQLFAYQQGSYFLYDIREDAAESGTAGRILVATSAFKSKAVKPETRIARQRSKSAFETKVTSLKTETLTTDTGGIKILDSKSEKATIEPSFGESGFGEDPPAPSGFFFTY